MELHAVDGIVAVLKSHDFEGLAVVVNPCGDFQAVGHSFLWDDQAVVTSRLKGIGQSSEYSFIAVCDHRRLAMHEPIRSDDFGSVNVRKALMAEAYAEHRQLRPKVTDDIARQPGFGRRTRARRNDDPLGLHVFDFFECHLVVSFDPDLNRWINLTDSLDKIEGEGVVVIEKEDHCEDLIRFSWLIQKPVQSDVAAFRLIGMISAGHKASERCSRPIPRFFKVAPLAG